MTKCTLLVLAMLVAATTGCCRDGIPITEVTVWDKDFQVVHTITDTTNLASFKEVWEDRTSVSPRPKFTPRVDIATSADIANYLSSLPKFTHSVDIATSESSVRWRYDPDGYATVLSMKASTPVYRFREPQKLKGMLISQQGTEGNKFLTLDLGRGVTMKLVRIPAGTFMMGSPAAEAKREKDEGPQRRVTITKAFYMSVYEVTQEQYEAVTGKNPSEFKGARNPVNDLSWTDAAAFCRALSRKTGKAARLPTEAEWEYACRAGTTTPFNTGETISADKANYDGSSTYGKGSKGDFRKKIIAVGSFKPNAFGLYDMHGNVSEWCGDFYGKTSYAKAANRDPAGGRPSHLRVSRGGFWADPPWWFRSAARSGYSPNPPLLTVGIRVVVTVANVDAAPRPVKTTDKHLTVGLGRGVSMTLVKIPAGTFVMGSPTTEARRQRLKNEGPQHRVTITRPFHMGIYEVTQEQYQAVMGKNPSEIKVARNPVESVSWIDATAFCKAMSGKTGRTVRLPTEAEWEYACRAGTTTPFNTGSTITTDQANFAGEGMPFDGRWGVNRREPIKVGRFKPNAFGLYDMHGNVSEWCSDRYGDYTDTDARDPVGPNSGRHHVFRGGCWKYGPGASRAASRSWSPPDSWRDIIGFRVVVECQKD